MLRNPPWQHLGHVHVTQFAPVLPVKKGVRLVGGKAVRRSLCPASSSPSDELMVMESSQGPLEIS